MNVGKLLQPDLVLGTSVLALSPEVLQHYNLRGLILDVDDTLVPWQATDALPELRAWMATISTWGPVWLVSNNVNATRISRIAHALDAPYLTAAGKPSRRKLRQALTAMALPPQQVAMVGDRLFTDVLAGNRVGLFTILVEPIDQQNHGPRRLSLRQLEASISLRLGVSLEVNRQF